MSAQNQPFIATTQSLPELTFKVICLSIILAVILAASNTYLALKIGILTSASIPAAVLSMGILRFFKDSNILQNNLVQTAASAGEAVAGGIVYTIPALVIIHYWAGFSYLENLAVALTGGILGVLFSIPLRRVLMTERNLNYPEGKAIAELLIMGEKKAIGFKEMLLGGTVGGLLELAQTGLQVITGSIQKWFVCGKAYVGFGAGFSATLVGAGYLMGFRVGVSIFLGAILGWLLGIPVLSAQAGIVTANADATQAVMTFWSSQVRYLGIGAMLAAGAYTLLTLFKPFCASMKASIKALHQHQFGATEIPRTERDIPLFYIVSGIFLIMVSIYGLLRHVFHYENLGLSGFAEPSFLLGCLLYILVIGFVFSAICGYFSGLVGVTASPGSSIVIAALLLAALIIRSLFTEALTPLQLKEAAAITILLGAIITGSAAIANDNIQDLKVGHIVGATPWKQQVMLIIGVIMAALIIPSVMQLLFNVYGIADVMPRPDMDPSKTLSAPPAAMMATVAQAVFNHNLPSEMIIYGVLLILPVIMVNFILSQKGYGFSVLAVAIGIYLPLTSSIPLFIGACINQLNQHFLSKTPVKEGTDQNRQKGIMLACGLVSGAALMDVILAIPSALAHNPEIFKIMPASAAWLANILGFLSVITLGIWFHKKVVSGQN